MARLFKLNVSALFLSMVVTFIAESGFAYVSKADSIRGRYFLVVWSYQGPDDDVVHSHTFLSAYNGDDLAKGAVRPFTISWLPASGSVHLFGAERGRNFSLATTLAMACQAGRQVAHWGPFEITHDLYSRVKKRIALLQSGRIRYEMVSSSPNAMNCINAAGDVTPNPLDTGILWGVAAGAEVAHHLSPYFVGNGIEAPKLSQLVRGCEPSKNDQPQQAASE